MTKLADGGAKSWDDGLLGRLQAFVNVWRSFQGTELAGAQEFLKSLVDIYDVSYLPGTIFEQHPIKIPARIGKPCRRAFSKNRRLRTRPSAWTSTCPRFAFGR